MNRLDDKLVQKVGRPTLPTVVRFARRVAIVSTFALWPYNLFTTYVFPGRDVRFDRAIWLADTDRMHARRGPMLTDLIAHHLCRGMTHADVVRLLGQPDEFSVPAGEGYRVTYPQILSEDSALYFRYDSSERVATITRYDN